MSYSVHNEPDFARTYDEDEMVTIRKGDLRAVLDLATQSMDFGSGFLCEEDVECLHKVAEVLGVDKLLVTPSNFTCKYKGEHDWAWQGAWGRPGWHCRLCNHHDDTRPPPDDAPLFNPPRRDNQAPVRLEVSTADGLIIGEVIGEFNGTHVIIGTANAIPVGVYGLRWVHDGQVLLNATTEVREGLWTTHFPVTR